jgi:hypothetical protein
MAMEITIFEVPPGDPGQTRTQKELEYEEYERVSGAPPEHFRRLLELEELSERVAPPASNIPAILCKFVLQYTTPILAGNTKDYCISVQNEVSTEVYDPQLRRSRVVPPQEQFRVAGVILPGLLFRKYPRTMVSFRDSIGTKALGLTGSYGVRDYQTGRFTQQHPGLTHPGLSLVNKGNPIIIWGDEKRGLGLLRALISYVEYVEGYYARSLGQLIRDLRPEEKAVDPPRTPWEWPGALTPAGKELMSLISDGATTNPIDARATLRRNGLEYSYDLGRFLGVTNKLYKREVAGYLSQQDHERLFQEQADLGVAQGLRDSKKLMIARRKYGVEDIRGLDKKQAKVVDLEYAKLERNLRKNPSARAKANQSLWYHLRNTFGDTSPKRLRDAVKKAQQSASKPELAGLELLEGGVCPHVVAWGAVLLKNFGKPWVNTALQSEVVQRYALPADRSGQYCQICGELLAEADTASLTQFIPGQTSAGFSEDPLLSGIWKEVMYAVNTYVRFSTPIPIKPLVASISAGLRGVIGEREAQLLRSRTNTTDNIRDTVSLYSAIYTYAVLVAMMMNNPKKMMFGRDDPDRDDRRADRQPRRKAGPSEGAVGQTGATTTKADVEEVDVEEADVEEADVEEVDVEEADVDANPAKASPKKASPKKASPKKASPKKASPKKASPKKASPKKARKTGKGESYLIEASPFLEEREEDRASRRQQKERKRDRSFKKALAVHGGKASQDLKKHERELLLTGLKLVLMTKGTVVRRLKQINTDVVKHLFLKEAYTWARKHSRPMKVAHSTENDDVEASHQYITKIDPMYAYAYHAHRLGKKTGGPRTLLDSTRVLGRGLKELHEDMKQGVSVYETATAPPPWNFKNPAGDKYAHDSFLMALAYRQQDVAGKTAVPMHPRRQAFYEEFAHVATQDKAQLQLLHLAGGYPLMDVPVDNDFSVYRNFSPARLDMARHYCLDGTKHVITKYVFRNKKKTMELTIKEIIGWLEEKKLDKLEWLRGADLINERCGNCNVLVRTASGQKSDVGMKTMFKTIDDLDAFYRYYDTRCPEGDLHNIVSGKCGKCGMPTGKIDTRNKASRAFFTKYKKTFQAVEQERRDHSASMLREMQAVRPEGFKKVTPPKHTQATKALAELARLTGVKYNVVLNLGLTEGVKFPDIEEGRVNPSKSLDPIRDRRRYLSQAYKLRAHILEIVRDYNRLKNHRRLHMAPREFKLLMDTQVKYGGIKVMDHLPPKLTGPARNGPLSTLPPNDYANAIHQLLATTLLEIHRRTKKPHQDFAEKLVRQMMDRIVLSERLLSKPDSIYSKRRATETMSIAQMEDDSGTDPGGSGVDLASMSEASDADAGFAQNSDDAEADGLYEDAGHGDIAEAYDVENANDVWDLE